jgi:hypothetical protein
MLRHVARFALFTVVVPGALWTIPISNDGSTAVVTPTGNIITGGCMSITRAGSIAWSMLPFVQNTANCATGIGDAQGNTYLLTADSVGSPVVESLDSLGNVRWRTPTGGFIAWRTGPVIGSNGSVYFSVWNGRATKVLGLDEKTGAITVERGFLDVTGLFAYSGGIIVVDTDGKVDYLSYGGVVQHEYDTGVPISAYEGYSSSGADGTVFLAGYAGTCSGGNVSVLKFTPTGAVWTWTDSSLRGCSQTLLTATPDGGVILARSGDSAAQTVAFTSISATGSFRWTHTDNGSLSPALSYIPSYMTPVVDVNGVVTLPTTFDYACSDSLNGQCAGARVEFVTQQTDSPALPRFDVTDSECCGFALYGLATDSDRVYLDGQTPSVEPQSLSAVMVPGLAMDYRLALQEALMQGSSPTPPSGSGDGSSSGGGSLSSGGNQTIPPPMNPCIPAHGSIGRELLASLACTAIQLKLEGECAAAVAQIILPQLRSIKTLKTAKGLYDLRKVKKSLRPLAKLFNDLMTFKFGSKAPVGFKTGADVIKKLKAARTAYGVLRLLPNLVKALSSADFSEIALDLDKYFHLTPCVQAVANALNPQAVQSG